MSARLARITVCGPRRRIDLALPGHLPVAELLPDLLRHCGDGLADDGEQHGGWVLRRSDGDPVAAGQPLHQQGIRDGDLLHLVPGRMYWPEPEYDDVVEVVADTVRRRSGDWSSSATRRYALATTGVWLAVGLLVLLTAGTPRLATTALLTSAVLAVVAVLAARAWRDPVTGVVLGCWSLPYAFAGGALSVSDAGPSAAGPGWLSTAGLLAGSVSLLLTAFLVAVGVAAGLSMFAAAGTVGLLSGVVAVAAMTVTDAAGAAAVLLAIVVCGIGLLPRLAIRLAPVPVPVATSPAAVSADPSRVTFHVARAERLLTGMLGGYAVLTAGAAAVLVLDPGIADQALVGVAAVALPLRSRAFAAARHQLPLRLAGLAAAVLLVAVGLPAGGLLPPAGTGPPVLVPLLGLIALSTVAVGVRHAARAPSPYLGRAADLLETGVVVATIPTACAVLGLYRWATGLLG
ncbi:type VII secretion integral membrane protein EccD [Solwaraspora sp. WMMB335]|uniref:type VII secretion integral membrane protein EccD n=1 Tax=Solwaraspora sp. WMMB335 TaxID=3404118 RepID=UPI003B960DBF